MEVQHTFPVKFVVVIFKHWSSHAKITQFNNT